MTIVNRPRQVLDAALRSFSEQGVEATSIERIRALSGVSVGSIYHHFGDKEGIARALYLEGLRDANALGLARLEAARTAREGVQALVAAFVEWITANPQWARFIYARATVGSGGPAPELKALNEAFFGRLATWLAPYQAKGQLRPLPLMAIVALIYGPVYAYARRWLVGEATEPPMALLAAFADAAWRAVQAPRPRRTVRHRK